MPEAAPEVLLDLWFARHEDNTVTVERKHIEGDVHPDWLTNQMLRTLALHPCQNGVVVDAIRWPHPDFWISGYESAVENDLRLFIRPKTQKEKEANGDR